jgi:phenylpropionate dioxygenase-like ring-hydroxylating dioxygenase large terminal subunit
MMKNLIPNMWYAILDSSEVPIGKPVGFKRLGVELVFWRDSAGKVAVMHDRCPHRQSKLSPGKLVGGNLQCHFHGFQYNREGACQLIPANGRNGPKPKIFQCKTYIAQEAHGFIWLWTGEPQTEYPPLPFFAGLDNLVYSTLQKQWHVHYTRAIEGNLDVSHLPFVHAKTIGRGMGTLVNGPFTTLENNEIRVWFSNQPDEGLPAIKPTELPPPTGPAMLWFNFPNVWQLWLGETLRNLQISAPIDENETMLYLRTYQGFVKIPVVGQWLGQLSNLYNRYVLREDELIITTQYPNYGDLNAGYFIPGDRPIALYLQHRQALIEGSTQSTEPALAISVQAQ